MQKLALLVLCCCAVPAQAALFRYEPFNYPDMGSTLQGKTNPDGETWQRAGVADPPSEITVASGNLAVPAELQTAVGNSLEIDGVGNGASSSNRLAIGQTISAAGSTVYYSFALRIDELTGSTNTTGGFFVALNNSTGSQATNPTAAAAKIQGRIDPTDGTKYNLGIFRNLNATAAATSWSGPLTVGDTLFVVASYEIVTGATNDIARLWINPNPSTFGDALFSPGTTPPTIADTSTGTGTDIGIASILLRQSPAPHLSLDELRVGDTWADVTPLVPEPGSLALLAIGWAAVWRWRRVR